MSKESVQLQENQQGENFIKVASFSIIGLLFIIAFSYLEFLGWMYMSNGNVILSNVMTLAIAIVLFVTSFLLPRIKASNQNGVVKRRRFYQSVTLLFFVLAVCLGYVAEMHFFKVQKNEKQLQESYTVALNQAKGIYPAYQDYTNNRLDAYKQTLQNVAKNKKTTQYQELLGQFPGTNDSQKIAYLVSSLKRTLTPTNQKLQEHFNIWLSKAGDVNVWNVSFIGNVNMLDETIQNYINSLSKLSSQYFHPGEQIVSFSYPEFHSLGNMRETFKFTGFYYSNRSLLTILILILALCGQWLTIERSHKDIQTVE